MFGHLTQKFLSEEKMNIVGITTKQQYQDFYNLYADNYKSLMDMPFIRDVNFLFALFITHYPMKENKVKMFLKLGQKSKFGVLSKHIISTANKVGVDKELIKNYIKQKETFDLYKRIFKGQKEREGEILDSYKNFDPEPLTVYYKFEGKKEVAGRILLDTTIHMIDVIMEKKFVAKSDL